ncbi:UNVERIFIED_CONTAM: hypothetical protein Slati_1280900 [Sesamum latifolium]|uniref:Uncharacterized protein n=1 Tax=Sesamum latifolium TaxID=2727402 RepID=A0AAW2XGE2_9LAMI
MERSQSQEILLYNEIPLKDRRITGGQPPCPGPLKDHRFTGATPLLGSSEGPSIHRGHPPAQVF